LKAGLQERNHKEMVRGYGFLSKSEAVNKMPGVLETVIRSLGWQRAIAVSMFGRSVMYNLHLCPKALLYNGSLPSIWDIK
jgi:hypothetical protein